ncbi:FHA domain-containing protein [Paucibacter sp. APW11]|uniref:FHA domain-containing protein n=1 Tax=Roseateles aquae TaxID=3077235 RepID=A0ABU3PDP5_9BURK|nr:FHA domain-containing protein [Paucibacter sp. APW11]MDT9000253.1 FHA domain-containing protein [Paucibacter sp. APW11]
MVHAAVIEILDRDGRVRQSHKVQGWPLSVGRSPECTLVLADPHLAGFHAELHWTEQGPELQMLDSINGGWLGRQRLQPGQRSAWPTTTVLQLGASLLRLRTSLEALPEERPLSQPETSRSHLRHLWVPALASLWALLLWYDQWANLDPGARWTDYAGPVLWPLAIVAGWAALWSLVTQLFQHWFPFHAHLKRALIGLTGLHLLGMALPVVAYAFSVPRLMALDSLAFPCGIAALLWWHASAVWPRARRGLAMVLVAMLLLGFGLMAAKRSEQQHWFGPAYLSNLPPPALRLVAPKTPEQLLDSLRPLEAELARQAGKENDTPSLDGNSD